MSSRDNSVKKAVHKIVCRMFLSAQAAVTKLHRLGGPYNSYLSSQVLEAGSPRPRHQQIWYLAEIPTSWLRGTILPLPSRGKRVRELLRSLLRRALTPFIGLHPHSPLTSQRHHLRITSLWELGSTHKFGGIQTFRPL